MTYFETIEYLYSLQWRGIKVGLANMDRLMSVLGAPHLCFPSIHIAGTNGKGSVAAILASILRAHGVRVGLYTSPHLVDFNERITINGDPISNEDLVAQVEHIRDSLRDPMTMDFRESGESLPTFFEFTTALAFSHFAREGVEMAVAEVGMGGRFDATNILNPRVSVITPIDRDHCVHLGDTLGQIAFEKAGIIKPGVPVVTLETKAEALNVIECRAEEEKTDLRRLGVEFKVRGEDSNDFTFQGRALALEHLQCGLQGFHQVQNAGAALAALEVLNQKGVVLEEDRVRQGLKEVSWPGRFQIVRHHPLVVLDGAHNPAAAKVLARILQGYRNQGKRLTLVLGLLKDKEIGAIFSELVPLAGEVILTRPDYERAAPLSMLESVLRPFHVPFKSYSKVPEAFEWALRTSHPEDLICVTGSLYTVGEVKAHLEGRVPSLLKG